MSVRDPPTQNRYLDLKEKEMMYMKHMHALTHLHPLINVKPPEICGRVKVIDKKSAQFRKTYMKNVKIRDQLIRNVNQLRSMRSNSSNRRKRSQSVDWNVVESHRTRKVDPYQSLDLFQNDYTHIKAPKKTDDLKELTDSEFSSPSDSDISTDSLKESSFHSQTKSHSSRRNSSSHSAKDKSSSIRRSSASSRRASVSDRHSHASSHHSTASNASSARAPRNHKTKSKQQQNIDDIFEIATTTFQKSIKPPSESDHSSYRRRNDSSSHASEVHPPSESSRKSARSKKSVNNISTKGSDKSNNASKSSRNSVFATNPHENTVISDSPADDLEINQQDSEIHQHDSDKNHRDSDKNQQDSELNHQDSDKNQQDSELNHQDSDKNQQDSELNHQDSDKNQQDSHAENEDSLDREIEKDNTDTLKSTGGFDNFDNFEDI